MRKLALSLLACGAASLSVAAGAQDDPPSSAEDYVCAFAGNCDEEAADEATDETATPDGRRPRISATRGFSLGPAPGARRPAAARPRRPGTAATQRRGARAITQRRPAAAAGQRVNLRLAFETGSARLTPAATEQARVFGRALMLPQLANMRFRIEGHTDSVGSRAGNVALSQRRAQSVADFLIAMGVPRARLDVRGYGPDRPLPGTGGASAQNRRVEAVRVS
ncbi:MAG: OmpA-OmpF porin, family [Sphingomonadales bacterium]|jgi:outer membrane protein OmpA-like peptidoglycan-associated protein|nr:OmpA-OmpF porin, family [Sphingomonadales bacterium]